MKTWKTLFAAALLTAFAAQAQAGAIDALKKFNDDADGISGSFTQTVRSKKKTQTSSGSFKILRPGLFRWEYTKPYQQTIVGDGKTIWLYDVELKQVTKSDQNQAIGDSPAAILSNKTALDASYSLKEDGSKNGVEMQGHFYGPQAEQVGGIFKGPATDIPGIDEPTPGMGSFGARRL